MSLADWLHKYPRVQVLMQQKDEVLLYGEGYETAHCDICSPLRSARIALHGPLHWPSIPRPLNHLAAWQDEVEVVRRAIITHCHTTRVGFQLYVDPTYWFQAQEWCWQPSVPDVRLHGIPVAMLEQLAQGEWALQWWPDAEEDRSASPPRGIEFQHPLPRSQTICCTTFPAPICSCGRYLLAWSSTVG